MEKLKRISDADVAHFNEWRERVQNETFSKEKIKDELKTQCNLPSTDNFLIVMSAGENAPIKKVMNDVYKVSQQPVYRDRLQKVIEEYERYIEKINLEEAILALKMAGYRIQKPDIRWIEI